MAGSKCLRLRLLQMIQSGRGGYNLPQAVCDSVPLESVVIEPIVRNGDEDITGSDGGNDPDISGARQMATENPGRVGVTACRHVGYMALFSKRLEEDWLENGPVSVYKSVLDDVCSGRDKIYLAGE